VTGTRTLICFDYGKKRIGVAVGQTLTASASPLKTIPANSGIPDWDAISRILDEWQPDALVVGKPLNMDDSGQAMTRASNTFAKELSERYSLPVYRADERLSSYEAKFRLKDTYNLDPVAAQVILETWLSENSEPKFNNDTIGS
jgi:putative Holliday junction resolvase